MNKIPSKFVPKLRYPGHKEPWKFLKMRDISSINQGLQIPIEKRLTEKVEGSYFYITNEFLRKDSKRAYYILNPASSVTCVEDDILMTRTGNTGLVVTGVSGVFHNNFFKISYKRDVNKYFLYYFLTSHSTQQTLLKLAGTSTIPDLNHGDFYSIPISIPNLTEQQKIAEFLTAVDRRITQLSQKKALLEAYKKGVMQQLFTQALRFKDDHGNDFPDWKEKMLGEIGKTYGGLFGKTGQDFGEGKLYVTYKQIFDRATIDLSGCERVRIDSEENQNRLKKGDVLFTTSSETRLEVGYTSVLLENADELYLNSFCFGFRMNNSEDLLPEFAQFLFHSRKVRESISLLGQGSTRYNISKNELMKQLIKLPSLPEQTKIANFLTALDRKIEAVASQITYMQTWKKGLLQQMFV